MIAQIDSEYWRINKSAAIRRIVTRLLFEGRPVTTNYRWLNHFVLAHLRFSTRFPQRSVDKPVFIIGTGRSGTTVLSSILSLHSKVGMLFEPKAIWHVIDKSEDVLGHFGSTLPARFQLDCANEIASKITMRLFGWYSAVTRSERIIDKTPENTFRVKFIKSIFPDARFVYLSRNGFSTIKSIANWSRVNGVKVAGEVHDWWGVDNRKWHLMLDELLPLEPELLKHKDYLLDNPSENDRAAVEWILTTRYALRVMHEFSDSFLHITYEELVENPAETLSNLFEFCGLGFEQDVVAYAEQRLGKVSTHSRPELTTFLENLVHETMGLV